MSHDDDTQRLEARTRVVVLSTADFDREVWTNKQYIAVGLAESFDVVYVDSLGLRRPTLGRRDLARLLLKVRRALGLAGATSRSGPRVRPPNLAVVSPTVLPFHGSAMARRINGRLMRRLARRLALNDRDVLWTFSPLTYGWEDHVGRTVYQSVDLLHHLPRVPTEALLEAERTLARRADAVIVSSSVIGDHLRASADVEARVWTNVADTDLYASAIGCEPRQPRAIFAGHLASSKFDFACLRDLLAHDVDVVIAGEVAADGDPIAERDLALLDHPRVSYLGLLTPQELAREVARSMVGLIPYLRNTHTAGIFPMKVYEYQAAGLSILSTRMPSLDGVEVRGLERMEPSEFGRTAVRLISEFSEDHARELSAASAPHTWSARMQSARALVDELCTA
ncbi:glycosyltransferase family 1 protein [Nocardioides rubriscoriae]|uniref:glycosyltransferase family 1 protein n=1 Tax=Nocardioides rubriscoriae TaxID=642762 RepID=UPI0011E06D8A|nr:glycosyltransferase family 1 protein [Nocardioides rubriscoriae]